jgi:hypothetical protein
MTDYEDLLKIMFGSQLDEVKKAARKQVNSAVIERYCMLGVTLLLGSAGQDSVDAVFDAVYRTSVADVNERDDDDADFLLISKSDYIEMIKQVVEKLRKSTTKFAEATCDDDLDVPF